jgi:hypothetical protein
VVKRQHEEMIALTDAEQACAKQWTTREIERLALEDMPRAGFEDRLFAATMPVLTKAAAGARDQPRLVLAGRPADARRVGRPMRLHAPMRLAASVALLVTVGAVWLANRPGGAYMPVPRVQTDDWAIAASLFDDSAVKELEQVASDTDGLDDRIRALNDNDFLDEGAM